MRGREGEGGRRKGRKEWSELARGFIRPCKWQSKLTSQRMNRLEFRQFKEEKERVETVEVTITTCMSYAAEPANESSD